MNEHTQAEEDTDVNEQDVLQNTDYPEVYFFQHEDSHAGEAVREMFDAVVRHTYTNQRHINWVVCTPDTTTDSEILGFDVEQAQGHTGSVMCSGIVLFQHLGWGDAAQTLHETMFSVLTAQPPEDIVVRGMDGQVSSIEYYAAVIHTLENDKAESYHDEFTDTLHDVFDASAEKTSEFAHVAMEKARVQGEKIRTLVGDDFSRVAKEKLNPSRLGAGALASMAKLMHVTGVALSKFADKADHALTCKSGEITSAGRLECKACGYEMHFKKTGRIPPCPKCHKTEFKKGY